MEEKIEEHAVVPMGIQIIGIRETLICPLHINPETIIIVGHVELALILAHSAKHLQWVTNGMHHSATVSMETQPMFGIHDSVGHI